MNDLFISLIQVSLGIKESLSRVPTEEEWSVLSEMAAGQAVSAICLEGVKKLYHSSRSLDRDYLSWNLMHGTGNLSRPVYLNWMLNATRIQEANQKINAHCVELQNALSDWSMRSAVLKGQGIAKLYRFDTDGIDPTLLRHPGDIDLWVDASESDVVKFAEKYGLTQAPSYLHVGTSFNGTPVELHYRPTYSRCFIHNSRLMRFCDAHMQDWEKIDGIVITSWHFNAIYLLSHVYRHLFGLGVGMRQVMDYYFLLKSRPSSVSIESVVRDMKSVGLYGFARAMMWVMKTVFNLGEEFLLCAPDARRGAELLDCIMRDGNFGQNNKSRISRKFQRNCRMLLSYPVEILSEPFWKLYVKVR